MRFKDVLSRVRGLSCSVFGISCNPAKPEILAAHKLLRALEDRRVLYNPFALENPHHCINSVIEVRKILTDALTERHVSSDFADNLKAMRAACRKFLNRTQPESGRNHGHPYHGAWGRNYFFDALGEFRGVFGIHIVQIAARYGLDIEDELASILPGTDDDDTDSRTASRERLNPESGGQ